MELKDQVCTKQQGKRLEELDVTMKSIFCHCIISTHPTGEAYGYDILPTEFDLKEINLQNATFDAPAYTVAELGEMLPYSIEGREWYMRNCWKGISFGYNGRNAGLPHIEQDWYPKEKWAEALADLLIRLLEQKLITPNQQK